MGIDAVRYEEFGGLWPAIAALGKADLFDPERFAMGRAGIMFMRCAVADMAVDDDQGRKRAAGLEGLNRLGETLRIIGVDNPDNVPAKARSVCPSMVIRLLS